MNPQPPIQIEVRPEDNSTTYGYLGYVPSVGDTVQIGSRPEFIVTKITHFGSDERDVAGRPSGHLLVVVWVRPA